MAKSKPDSEISELRKEIENLKDNLHLALEALAGMEEDQMEYSESNRCCFNAVYDRLDKIEWAINNGPVTYGTYRSELPCQ
jgi:hypothetical protein